MQDLDAAQIAALPADGADRISTSLRAHYDEVMKAQALAQPGHVDGRARRSRAAPGGGR